MKTRSGLNRTREDRGMTLVMALAVIALLSIAVMAFFSQVRSIRLIEDSRSRRTEADLLCRSASDYVTGLFLKEIADPANSTAVTNNSVSIFTPLANTGILPKRAISSAIGMADTGFCNLIRQSVPGADPNASAADQLTSAARWNAPLLLTGTGFTNPDQLPHWVYVTGTGVTGSATRSSIGRFSYNVYDIGGLLNINAAGHPVALTAQQLAQIASTVVMADLTQLDPGIRPEDVEKLITFRNPNNKDADTFLSGISIARSGGFLTSVASSTSATTVTSCTSNYFTSRQDLLRYARTQNPALVKALPYLTHFSRAVTAPSWSPDRNAVDIQAGGLAASAYKANAEQPASANRNIPNVRFSGDGDVEHYRDDGTSFTYTVQPGKPLIQYRFSLGKLAWLTCKGPSAQLSTGDRYYHPGGTDTAIEACFGLRWDSAKECWNYIATGINGTGGASIKTLDTVASEKREPNFFEYLKAGILSNSLGLKSQATTLANTGQMDIDGSPDLQILRIGANIIDCADTDNYPTILASNIGGTIEIAGVEDLPYFHSLWFRGFQQWDETQTQVMECDAVCIPTLINPHRPSLSAATSGPSGLSLNISNGLLSRISDNDQNFAQGNMKTDLAARPAISISGTPNFESFRLGPTAISNASAANSLGVLVPYATEDRDKQGFLLFSYKNEYKAGVWPATVAGVVNKRNHTTIDLSINMSGFMMRLQYLTPGGRLKTYATFSGNDQLPSTSGMLPSAASKNYFNFPAGFDFASPKNITTTGVGARAQTFDPRSNRFGPSGFLSPGLTELPQFSGNDDRLFLNSPFSDSNADKKTDYPNFPGLWPQGGKSRDLTKTTKQPGWFSNMADNDGVYRPADGWLGDTANPYRQLQGSTLDPNTPSRPVLLQRPYQSVAELGYVYRDNPWKTLSFFDDTSADAALLDLFAIADEPAFTAGKVHLATRQPLVRKALFLNAAREPDGTQPLTNGIAITTALDNYCFTSGSAAATLPANVAQLSKFMSSAGLTSALPAAAYPFKNHREAVVRTLADSTQTRTWNLLIDLIAQCGRGTSSATFIVEGEQRYWLSIAIDRFTGKIVDQQLEPVNE